MSQPISMRLIRLFLRSTSIVIVATSLLFPHGVQAEGTVLGVLSDEGANLVTLSASHLAAEPIATLEPAKVITADRTRGTFWLAGTDRLSAYDRTGQSLFSAPIEISPSAGSTRRLAVDAADGSVWLAAGTSLLGFTAGGQPIHSVEIGTSAVEIAVDSRTRRLWWASSDQLVAINTLNGFEDHRISVADGPAITAIALASPGSNGDDAGAETFEPVAPRDLWMSRGSQLFKLSPTGELLRERELNLDASVSALVSYGNGAV
ncbi:MAG: hypothetical protein AAFY88_07760, partial [Acidobacteriota bacterium]